MADDTQAAEAAAPIDPKAAAVAEAEALRAKLAELGYDTAGVDAALAALNAPPPPPPHPFVTELEALADKVKARAAELEGELSSEIRIVLHHIAVGVGGLRDYLLARDPQSHE